MFRLLLIILFLGIFIVFAMSNQTEETFWLFSFGWKVSLGVSVLAIASISLFFGIILGGVGDFMHRHRVRKNNKKMEKEISGLQNELLEEKKKSENLRQELAAKNIEPTAPAPVVSEVPKEA